MSKEKLRSKNYTDDLVSRLSRMNVGQKLSPGRTYVTKITSQKKSVIDCKECFTCNHLTGCSLYNCGTCKKAVETGCQNKFCKRHKCRENEMKCNCTTRRLLSQFSDTSHLRKGSKEVFGWFNCSQKRGEKTIVCKRWNSAHAWIDMGKLLTQQCQKCKKPCRPIKVKLKEWRGGQESSGEKPHDEVNCFN